MRIRTPQTRTTRLGATALAGVVGASLLGLGSAPALAVPGPVVAHEAAECTVTDTVLTWGVKESFRSYIDTIAKGTATPDGEGVTYETPNYIWAPGSGTVSNHGDAASIAQTGTVHFEGHEGVLQLFVANPSLEIVSAEEAYLRLDLKSTTPTGEEAIDEQQVRAVELDIAGRLSADGVALTLDAAPGKLTPEGAKAFGRFYAAYDEMDPVTLTGKTSCEFEAGALPEPESTETPQAQDGVDAFPDADAEADAEGSAVDGSGEETADGGVPVLPVVIGAIAAAVILGVGIMLISGARRRPDTSALSEDAQIDAAQVTQAPGAGEPGTATPEAEHGETRDGDAGPRDEQPKP